MKIYLDNAATTPIDPQVADAMLPYIWNKFGNPSSTHSYGREVKASIELARKGIADQLNVTPSEIYFTSGGTESINTILRGAVFGRGLKHAISSPIEHHAVLHVLEEMEEEGLIELSLLDVDDKGNLDLEQLREYLSTREQCLVSLMHANNEIANLNDIETIGEMCSEFGAYFHSDTVQSMGHFDLDLPSLKVDAVVCSAHKIHGPKGIGFMYLKKDRKLPAFLLGGGQERNMRGGTENVIGIAGLSKAFEIATTEMGTQAEYILKLKIRMRDQLAARIPGVKFNGLSDSPESLYTVLNVCLPPTDKGDMMLFQLDLAGVSASGGSACNSGAQKGSHVLDALRVDSNCTNIRFSFSKFNTPEEIDRSVETILSIIDPV